MSEVVVIWRSGIMSMNFLCSVTLTSIGLSFTLSGVFTMFKFIKSCIDHAKNTGLLSYRDIPTVDKCCSTVS